jgi:multiple sugar transport system permease protein
MAIDTATMLARAEEARHPAVAPPRRRRTGRPMRYAALLVIAAAFLLPFVVMLATAVKEPTDVFRFPPRLLPERWTADNFGAAIDAMPFWRYLANTLLISALAVAGTLLSCPLVGYALAKLRWRGRGTVLALVLATMMLPPQVTLVPLYLMWDKVGLTGTYLPLVAPCFFGTPFFIFLMRQFLANLPDDLIEAARLDGASELRIYWRIVLPLARPALATIAVFQFVWAWTDFLNPLIYLDDDTEYTLSVGLYNFFSEHGVDWGPLMAASVLFTAPALVIFLIGQRHFVEGIATKGLK